MKQKKTIAGQLLKITRIHCEVGNSRTFGKSLSDQVEFAWLQEVKMMSC